MRSPVALLAALALAGLAAWPAAAHVRIFSYDPANDVTRRVAGALTFEFDQKMVFVRVLRIRATEGEATADLKPAGDGVLGHGGLSGVIGNKARERDLYEVRPDAEGADLIRAFCPSSRRVWLAFGRIEEERDLRVQVIGDSPGGGPPRLCETLDFSFHGEWKLPAGQSVRIQDVKTPHFPY
jgi:hypothetical protein